MLVDVVGFFALFAQRPPPDWQNSFWSSPLGVLLILLFVVVGPMLMNRKR
jgi:hypothetical protein